MTNATQTTFTKKEAEILRALIDNLYAEPGFSDVDAQDLAEVTGLGIQAVGGLLTQLEAKGILFVEELSPRTGHIGMDENLIYLTETGERYHARWAEEEGLEALQIIER